MDPHDKHNEDNDRLDDFRDHLGDDTDFFPTEAETEALLARVNDAIDAREKSTAVRPTPVWKQLLATAAALVLVVGGTIVALKTGMVDFNDTAVTQSTAVDTSALMARVTAYEQELYALDDGDVQVLLREAVSEHGFESTERLLGDLTEEELEYLEASFDVGDLL
ncbi:hypothetical protein GF420_10835 [candidate division GN15 bacterium]|nr:hypothetical protein [candidate division GN15 bacterium]